MLGFPSKYKDYVKLRSEPENSATFVGRRVSATRNNFLTMSER
jgi:hypothetical protein